MIEKLIDSPYTFEALTKPIRTEFLRIMLWRTREKLALERGEAMLIVKNKQGKRIAYEPLPGENTQEILSNGILKLENLIAEREEEELNGIKDYRHLP